MDKKIIIAAVIAIAGAYFFGYSNAETQAALEFEQYKNEQEQAANAAQEKIKADYEKRLENLSADLERIRNDNDKRLRELEQFKRRAVNLETCRSERERLASVAVGLEDVASRAIGYLKSGRE